MCIHEVLFALYMKNPIPEEHRVGLERAGHYIIVFKPSGRLGISAFKGGAAGLVIFCGVNAPRHCLVQMHTSAGVRASQ